MGKDQGIKEIKLYCRQAQKHLNLVGPAFWLEMLSDMSSILYHASKIVFG